MQKKLLTLALLAWVSAGLSAPGCEPIPQICRDSCKQQDRCDPGFSDYGYSVRACRSDCEDSLEDQVRTVDDACKAAYLDYTGCVATLTCAELDEHDYSDCDQESLRLSQRCEAQW